MPIPTPFVTRTAPRALFALLLTALAVLVAAGTAAAASKPLYGIGGVSALPTVSHKDVDTALDDAVALRAKAVRVEALWSTLEPKAAGVRDPEALAALDYVAAAASQRKLKLLLTVDSTPCWASTSPSRGDCSAANPNVNAVTRYQPSAESTPALVSLSAFLAGRYAKDLAAFETWNEPDQSNELYWAGPDKIANYVRVAKAVYPAVKQAAPGVTVIAGAFVGGDGRWLQALYKAGIKGSYDALSVHFYDLPLSALTTTRKIQKANGDSKPLWLAEFGFTSCYKKGGPSFLIDHACNTRAGQMHNLVDVLRSIQKVSYVKAALMYTLYDQSTAYQFGVMTASRQRKPAWAQVRSVFSGGKPKVTKPKLTLGARKGRARISGTASQTEYYTLRVWKNGQLAYRATLRTDRFGKYGLSLPKALGTTGLKATLKGAWTGQVTRRR